MALDTSLLKSRHEEAEKKRKEMGSKLFFNLEEKKNIVRILPRSLKYFSPEKDDDFAVRYFVHYNLFDIEGFKMIVCNKTIGKSCPICEEAHKLNDKALVSKIRAKERFMYNVLDLTDGVIKILETGPKIYEEILKFVLNPEWGDLFGLKDGRNITIEKIPSEKSGTGWVEYTVMPSPMPSDVTEMVPEGWDVEIDKLSDKLPNLFDDAELKRIGECFKNGVSPVTAENSRKKDVISERQGSVTQSPSTEQKPKLTPQVPPDKQECFGLKYMPRAEKCKVCISDLKDACRTTYLSV